MIQQFTIEKKKEQKFTCSILAKKRENLIHSWQLPVHRCPINNQNSSCQLVVCFAVHHHAKHPGTHQRTHAHAHTQHPEMSRKKSGAQGSPLQRSHPPSRLLARAAPLDQVLHFSVGADAPRQQAEAALGAAIRGPATTVH